MPAPHYALSEALIVLAALWVGWQMVRRGAWLGAIGVAIFGFAAGIGVIRFGFSRIEELAEFHKAFAQIGGATAMALVAVQCCIAGMHGSAGWRLGIAMVLCMISLTLSLWAPGTTVLIFLTWLVVGAIACARLAAPALGLRLLRAVVFGSFAINVLLIRRSPLLGADASWHAYHVLIALWLVGLWWVLDNPADSLQPAQRKL